MEFRKEESNITWVNLQSPNDWRLRFISKNERLLDFIKSLEKAGIKLDLKIDDQPIELKGLPPINKIKRLTLNWHCWTNILDEKSGERTTTVCTGLDWEIAKKGLEKNVLKTIGLAGKTLQPHAFEVFNLQVNVNPLYSGLWSEKVFQEKILPQIEFIKRKKEFDQIINQRLALLKKHRHLVQDVLGFYKYWGDTILVTPMEIIRCTPEGQAKWIVEPRHSTFKFVHFEGKSLVIHEKLIEKPALKLPGIYESSLETGKFLKDSK